MLSSTLLFSQTIKDSTEKYFGRSYEVGTSLTYIWDWDGNYTPGVYRYDELTWNMNANMRLHERFWFGVQVAPIFTKTFIGGITKRNNYNFYGLCLQGDVFTNENGRIYLETSFNRSNMLNTYNNINGGQVKIEGINYLGMGGGFNLLLNKNGLKNLYLELAFFNYHVLNKIEYKSNYTQYIFGLNYRLGKKS